MGHQLLLSSTEDLLSFEDPLTKGNFSCAFIQDNPLDQTNSDECKKEIESTRNGTEKCEYWQSCNFHAVKDRHCRGFPASELAAIIIPVAILLLGTAIFAIYCFKRKAQQTDAEIEVRPSYSFL